MQLIVKFKGKYAVAAESLKYLYDPEEFEIPPPIRSYHIRGRIASREKAKPTALEIDEDD